MYLSYSIVLWISDKPSISICASLPLPCLVRGSTWPPESTRKNVYLETNPKPQKRHPEKAW